MANSRDDAKSPEIKFIVGKNCMFNILNNLIFKGCYL